MINKLKEWKNASGLSDTGWNLLEESIFCYIGGAYRASYIMAYLVILEVLRQRCITAKQPPPSIDKDRWDNVLKNLWDPGKWDAEVLGLAIRSEPNAVFSCFEEHRTELKYFRDRRNDCAHGKRDEVNTIDVEVIWRFILTQLDRFQVIGNQDAVLAEIVGMANPVRQASDKEIESVIEKVPVVVASQRLRTFLHELLQKMIPKGGNLLAAGIGERDVEIRIIDALVKINHDGIREVLGELLYNGQWLPYYLLSSPDNIHKLQLQVEWVAEITTTGRLLSAFNAPHYLRRVLSLPKIWDHLQPEALFDELLGQIHGRTVFETDDLQIFEEHGFKTFIEDRVFRIENNSVCGLINDFSWANKNAAFIALCVERYCDENFIWPPIGIIFSKQHYPFDLKEELDNLFRKNESLSTQIFKKIIENKNHCPTYLESFNEFISKTK